MYSLMADAVLVIHFLFIIFVVGGQVCIIIGGFRRWYWVRNRMFRMCHILAIAFVIAQAWASRLCPLTIWETALRSSAGEQHYTTTFVQHWIGTLIYYEAPMWVFALAYTFFGAVVLYSWFWIKPEKGNSRK
jgi:hypothetical protein